jgi:hypothetical protein
LLAIFAPYPNEFRDDADPMLLGVCLFYQPVIPPVIAGEKIPPRLSELPLNGSGKCLAMIQTVISIHPVQARKDLNGNGGIAGCWYL